MSLKSLAQAIFGAPVDLDTIDLVIGPTGTANFNASSIFSGSGERPQSESEYYQVQKDPAGNGWKLSHVKSGSMWSSSQEDVIEPSIPSLQEAVEKLRAASDEMAPRYAGIFNRFNGLSLDVPGHENSLNAVEAALRSRAAAAPAPRV